MIPKRFNALKSTGIGVEFGERLHVVMPSRYYTNGDPTTGEFDSDRMATNLDTTPGYYYFDIEAEFIKPPDMNHQDYLGFLNQRSLYWKDLIKTAQELRPDSFFTFYQVATRGADYFRKYDRWIREEPLDPSDIENLPRWTRQQEEIGEAMRPILDVTNLNLCSVYPIQLDSHPIEDTLGYMKQHINFMGRFFPPMVALLWHKSAHERDPFLLDWYKMVDMCKDRAPLGWWGGTGDVVEWDDPFWQVSYTTWKEIEPLA